MRKVFVDLNVILDVLDATRSRHTKAKEVLSRAIENDDTLVMSVDMLTNFFYICHKKFDCHQMLNYMAFIQETFVLCDFSKQTLETAMAEYENICHAQNHHADFEDLLQLACAKEQHCTIFLTEDKGIKDHPEEIAITSLAAFN
jgi:predicted nucleic acid-binding protein